MIIGSSTSKELTLTYVKSPLTVKFPPMTPFPEMLKSVPLNVLVALRFPASELPVTASAVRVPTLVILV